MGMTTNEPTNRELADLFAADTRWRWMLGMRYQGQRPDGSIYGMHLDWVPGPGGTCTLSGILARCWPDVEDHATLGCIEHGLVPEALGDPDACLCFSPLDRSWYVYSPKHDDCATSKATKPAALLAALAEADDIVRRSTAGRVHVEDFGDPDDLVDDEFEDRDLSDYERDGYDRDLFAGEPDEVPTDPKLCTRPAPAVAVAARGFLDAMRQREADREAQRKAKLRAKENPT